MAITATIHETFKSRDGTVRGTNGNSYRRMFKIRLIGKTDADRTELTEPDPAGFLESLHPFGHAHPWNNFMAANSYGPPRRIGPDLWDCGIGYAVVSESNPGTTGWIHTSGGNSIPQRTYVTLPDELGFTHIPNDPNPQITKGIGNRLFFAIASSAEALQSGYSVHTVSLDDNGVPVDEYRELVPTGVIQPEPEDVDLPGISVSFTKIILSQSVDIELIVRGFIKKVNDQPFLGGAVASVLLDSFTLDPITSADFQVNEDGGIRAARGGRTKIGPSSREIPDFPLQSVPAWRATLSFIASDVPFDPVERTPLWRDPVDGAESIVLHDNKPFVEKFFVIPRVDFGELFRSIS